MFYSQFILAKKGPLGTIWIAAHLERKLRKNQVADTDIGVSVDSILSPDVPIALRLSSHLLVGVVRIYSRKVNYLFDDCSEALLKVKQAFRSAAVDLPPEEAKAPYHSITLPETFDLDDFELPENEIFQGNFVDHHISSREQITLQDTMEGVSYSTSKFGLDERFGDGDASGLDLDEELFLDKIGTAEYASGSADPQASVGSMTPLKQEELPENRNADSGTRVDDDADDLVDYAQAPCTPGLLEEPTLSNVKEVSACDDHLESEYHLVESTMNENDKNEENLSRTLGESPLEAKVERVSGDESSLGQIKTLNSSLEFADKIMEASDVEVLQSGDADKIKNSSLTIGKPCHNQEGSREIGLEKSTCEISGLTDNFQQVSEGVSVKDQDIEAKDQEMASEQEKSCPDASDLATSNHDDHEKVASTETLFLRPCNSNVEEHDITTSGVQSDAAALETSGREETVMLGEACCATDNSEFTKENQIEEHEPEKYIHATLSEHDSQVPNANYSAEAELAAPEKLLSVPQGHEDIHKNMIVEGSPIGLDEGDAGSKIVSGKKRSFTESTLTEQSLNSVESSRLVRFKRTIDSVPDDDDLLSSILVGRSSVLKVKPTPRLSEVTSTKRTRSAPRTGPTKRKVLMDDSMVLHGDTIRRQLTNTEDIRRVRKKAPCTRPEISMIKKQYLEDEFFSEPSYTGMSIELASLHSEMCDLSRIRVCKDESNSAALDIVAEPGLPSKNDKNTLETMAEPISSSHDAKNDESLATAAEPHLTSQNAENDKPVNMDNNKGSQTPIDTEQSEERITSEILFDRDNNEVMEPSENPVLIDNRTEELDQTNIEINLSNKQTIPTNDMEADISQQERLLVETGQRNDDADVLPDENTDMPLVELDSAVMDVGNRPAAISKDELTEKDGDIDAAVETEPVVRDDEVARDDAKQGELEYNVLLGEHVFDSSYPAEIGLNGNSFMNNGEPSEAYERYMMDAESSGFDLHDQEELKYSAAGNDTEFLNVDDDDMTEMADDHIPDDEEARFAENTGWSSRTRAVSKYLQTLFVKEAELGRKSLSMDNLLIGKSRKEASRMFFEALVLKTRDYIHVEQRNTFDDIRIKPRTRLLKSEF